MHGTTTKKKKLDCVLCETGTGYFCILYIFNLCGGSRGEPGSIPRPSLVRTVVEKVTLEEVLFGAGGFSPVSTIPSVLHTCLVLLS